VVHFHIQKDILVEHIQELLMLVMVVVAQVVLVIHQQFLLVVQVVKAYKF
tara:strand:+ start:181 stop:330 length:150 start_codon:yes stop_codon:yes gene_type:complete